MINRISFILFYMAIIKANLCIAQPNSPGGAADWGKSVQLLISVTNSVFRAGSSATITSVTKNSSTNSIIVDISSPTVNFDVLLANDSGKLYHITTPMMIRKPRHFVTIKPGEESIESIPVTFGKTRFGDTVESGDYTLKATRHFSLSNEDYLHSSEGTFVLESNSIKVQIVK